jgi:hypothetical protein
MVFAAFHKVSARISRQKDGQTPSVPTELEEAVKTAVCFACKLEALISRTWDPGTADCMVTNIPERVNEVIEHGRPGKSDHVTRVKVGKAERQQRPSQDWRKENWDAMRADIYSPQSKDKD